MTKTAFNTPSGYTWADIMDVGFNWWGYDLWGLSWAAFSALNPQDRYTGYNWAGIHYIKHTWESFEGLRQPWEQLTRLLPEYQYEGFSWEDIHKMNLPWKPFGDLGMPWGTLDALIPGDWEDSISASVTQNGEVTLQLNAYNIRPIGNLIMNLRYDPAALEWNGYLPQGGIPTGRQAAVPEILLHTDGRLLLRYTKDAGKWSGLVAVPRFTAKQTAQTQIVLD